MRTYAEFDKRCEAWELEHPGEAVPLSELFGQCLANSSGCAVIGSPIGEAPSFVAIPDPVLPAYADE